METLRKLLVTCLAFFALLCQGCAPATAPALTQSPQANPTSTPAIIGSAQDIIIDSRDFPLPGYSLNRNTIIGCPGPGVGNGWRKTFSSVRILGQSTADYWQVTFHVCVYPDPTRASDTIADTNCAWLFTSGVDGLPPSAAELLGRGTPAQSARIIPAEVIGDGSVACRYQFRDATDWIVYTTGTRNVVVEVGVQQRLSTLSTGTAVSQAIALARLQLSLIERAAPR
jgi:hypothetical protein